jgi:tetratricopeptide (TPR) repeat protein
MLANALRLHQAGRLSEAGDIYRQILAADAQHADSLHLLGMIAYAEGRHETAITMVRKAIAINKTEAAYHSNLGTIFHALGRLEEAAECYESAVVLQPQLAKAHYNLGNLFQNQGKLEAAAECYKRALALQPELAEAHYNFGNLLQAQGKLNEAVGSYKRALALEPGKYEALHNLGNALEADGKLEDARACYEQVLNIQPDYAKAHLSLGSVLHALGNLKTAADHYRTARTLQPQFAEAAFAESLIQLVRGEFTPGWRNYEWRWRTKEHTPPMRSYAQPLWEGEKLESGRLLVWGEQGIGDEIMFAGLIADAIRVGNSCVLDCDARLKPLFARSFPGVDVVSSRGPGHGLDQDHPGRDAEMHVTAHLPSGGLPKLFRSSQAAFTATRSPYLVADPAERQKFRARYDDGRLLIGLAWYTNNRKTGRVRSVELSSFAPLFACPDIRRDIRWISLQYGDHETLENQATMAHAPLLIDRSVDQFSDIDLFAAQIAALDLVITIDNSTAHLAGALGIPTWLLLPFVADWRWLQVQESSPWYPSLRLFRQPARDDWPSVMQSVLKALCVSVQDQRSIHVRG